MVGNVSTGSTTDCSFQPDLFQQVPNCSFVFLGHRTTIALKTVLHYSKISYFCTGDITAITSLTIFTLFRYYLPFAHLFFCFSIQAQVKVTYYRHIAPILMQHCQPCHSEGGDAPFALTNYEQIAKKAASIVYVTANKYMPPYPADPEYRHFANENYLTLNEQNLIAQWVKSGKAIGKKNKHYNEKNVKKRNKTDIFTLKSTPDRVLSVPQTLSIKGDNKDRFERIVLPQHLDDSVAIAGFAFRNSNRRALHHSELMFCTANDCAHPNNFDGRVGDVLLYESKEIGGNYSYLSGWLPGQSAQNGDFFPQGFAKTMHKNTGFLYLLHYAPSPIAQTDSASIELYYATSNAPRPVESLDLHGTQVYGKKTFVIPPDTIVTLHNQLKVKSDFSVFAVMPHAHHLAQSMLAYAVTPNTDTIRLLKIDRWRFAWQWQYKLPKMLILPRGSTIHFWVTYNNTAQNPENPHRPPQKVFYSFDADSEMMELFLLGSSYRSGDEKLILKWKN